MGYSINYYCVSHIGKIRSVNQDNFYCKDMFMQDGNYTEGEIISGTVRAKDKTVFGIFDGMGGEECGEVASLIASKTISEYTFSRQTPQELKDYCKIANDEICKYTEENSLTSMGTTAAILLFCKNKIHLCNIGDSKIFRISKGGLKQISFDHVCTSVYGRKPPLTQNLGIREEELIISPFISQGKYCKGNKYLICSDGLTDMVGNDEIASIIENEAEDKVVEILLNKALENGGRDNITIIFLSLKKECFINKIKNALKGKKNGMHFD